MSFNVLIADDSSSMRAVIKKIITISGIKLNSCYESGNGKEALEKLKESRVDAIITGINMPEMNGLELLKALRQNSVYKDIPAIVVSTEGSAERMQEAMEAGAKGFIKKPFLPEDIRRVLYDVIGVGSDGEYQEDRSEADEVDF